MDLPIVSSIAALVIANLPQVNGAAQTLDYVYTPGQIQVNASGGASAIFSIAELETQFNATVSSETVNTGVLSVTYTADANALALLISNRLQGIKS